MKCLKFAILTLGCKVNYYDSNSIIKLLTQENYELVDFNSKADIYIINTCSVTNLSDRKSRQMLNRAKKINPDALIIAMGCYAQANAKKILDLNLADIVLGMNNKKEILALIKKYFDTKQAISNILDVRHENIFEECESKIFNLKDKKYKNDDRVRAFIKIQEGCDEFCSYCIIPFTRGKSRSRDLNKIYQEAKAFCDNGFKEIVLTGINVSAYGKDFNNKYNLADLIEKLSEIKNLFRIRLSSIEPNLINNKFVSRIKNIDKLCPHFHMSLQSGSDKILLSMNRKYNTQKYFEATELLKNNIKTLSLTTDIIVGFPDETEKDFLESYNFAEKIGFSKIHVFPFSERKNTRACNLKNKVSSQIKKQRVKMLIGLSDRLADSYNKKFINKNLSVLIEKKINNKYFGHSSNYIKVFFEPDNIKNNNQDFINKILELSISDANKDFVVAKPYYFSSC